MFLLSLARCSPALLGEAEVVPAITAVAAVQLSSWCSAAAAAAAALL